MNATTVDAKETLFALLHPIFRDCCDPEATRYDLSTPFVVGDFVYASDGRIIVRSQATPEITAAFAAVPTGNGRRLKDPASVYDSYDFPPDPLPLPDPTTLLECDRCDGKGQVVSRKCDECRGRGTVECNLGHKHDCEDCDGNGFLPAGKCEECDGFGRGGGYRTSIEVGNHLISHTFFLLLCRHGATVYETSDNPKAGMPPLKFTIVPDVEGRVMPMTRGSDS